MTGGGAEEAEQSHICNVRGIGTGALNFLYTILYQNQHCLSRHSNLDQFTSKLGKASSPFEYS